MRAKIGYRWYVLYVFNTKHILYNYIRFVTCTLRLQIKLFRENYEQAGCPPHVHHKTAAYSDSGYKDFRENMKALVEDKSAWDKGRYAPELNVAMLPERVYNKVIELLDGMVTDTGPYDIYDRNAFARTTKNMVSLC